MAVTVAIGLAKTALAFAGDWTRRAVPRAAPLGSIGAVATRLVAFVIDARFLLAGAVFAGASAASLCGLTHSPLANGGLFWPGAPPVAMTVHLAGGYGVAAALCWLASLGAPGTSPDRQRALRPEHVAEGKRRNAGGAVSRGSPDPGHWRAAPRLTLLSFRWRHAPEAAKIRAVQTTPTSCRAGGLR